MDTGVLSRGKSGRGVKLAPPLYLHLFKAWGDKTFLFVRLYHFKNLTVNRGPDTLRLSRLPLVT